MSRSVSVAASKGSVELPNGVVLAAGQSTVLSDAQWNTISGSTLVSGGTVIDGGASSATPAQGGSDPESDPVALDVIQDLREISTKTAAYTLVPSDAIVVSNLGTVLTHSLPTAATATKGKVYIVKNIGAGVVTVNVTGGGNIDAAATGTLAQWAVGRYVTNGTAWYTA